MSERSDHSSTCNPSSCPTCWERAGWIDPRVVLPAEVFDRLAAELDEPARPIPALMRLVERPRRVQLQQDDGEVTG